MNDLEIRGLKDLIKEIMEDETDYKNRIDELEEDVRELQSGNPSIDDEEDEPEEEPESELPEEETLEDNPEREVHEEKLEQAREKPTGTRVTKEDMATLQNAPARKKRPVADPEEELDDERWDEEQ